MMASVPCMAARMAALLAAAAVSLQAAASDQAPAAIQSCMAPSACVAAMLGAAQGADQVTLMGHMRGAIGLASTLPRIDHTAARKTARIANLNRMDPGPDRLLALHLAGQNRIDEALATLEPTLIRQPYHAPYWSALAVILHAAGRKPEAVSALVLAHEWSANKPSVRTAYAAQTDGVYAEALAAIEGRLAAAALEDAAFAPYLAGHKEYAQFAPEQQATINPQQCATPRYPITALMKEQSGEVLLAFHIDAKGEVRRAQIKTSSGYSDLDHSAMVAIAGCPATAALRKGTPVASSILVKYEFTLR